MCNLASHATDIIWVKLDRLFFGTNKDIHICAAYILPQNSSSNSGISLDDKFEGLRKKLDWYTTIGDVAIIGDLNSRVDTIQERHIRFNMDPNTVKITTVDYVPLRRSFDKNINAYGRKLLQILTDYDLMITCGRVWGDLTGRYTCCQRNGCSAVDMLLVQNDLFRFIDYFQIYDFDWYSDQAIISDFISVDIRRTLNMPSDWIRFTKQLMKWDLEAKEKFVSKISSPDVKHKLDEFCYQTHNTSQEAASAFTAIINGALKTVFRRKAKTDTQSNRPNKKRVPYSYELQIAKRNFVKIRKDILIKAMITLTGARCTYTIKSALESFFITLRKHITNKG